MNRPCPDRRDAIADYVLGALDDRQTEAVKRHIDGCRACRDYARDLRQQAQRLVELGGQTRADAEVRKNRALQALEHVSPAEARASRVLPFLGRVASMGLAAVLVLGAGVLLGRRTAPPPVDIEQLGAELQASVTASLAPAVHRSILAEVDRRIESVLAAHDANLRLELAEQIHRDLRAFATQFASRSEAGMDRRFGEMVQLVEAARLRDRQRVERAFRQLEQNRLRDNTQISRGMWTLAAQSNNSPPAIQN